MKQVPLQPEVDDTGNKHWKCSRCPSTFRRLDHLKRHTLTHDTTKSHVCPFCESSFSRGDVLRRHWKSCKTRVENGHAIPGPYRGGKHKRACDSCAAQRKACNGEQPCTECRHRERKCSYRRLLDDSDIAQAHSSHAASREFENCAVDVDVASASGSKWDLGIQTFYPSANILARSGCRN